MAKPSRGKAPDAPGFGIESMTGYGEARAKVGGVPLLCRARSLNHRFLDVKVRLPRPDMLGVDLAVRKRLSELFNRGSVEVTVSVDGRDDGTEFVVNEKAARAYWEAARSVARNMTKAAAGKPGAGPPPPSLSMDALFRLPGVCSPSGGNTDALASAPDAAVVSSAIEPALAALKESRRAEGAKLREHLLQLLLQMDRCLAVIERLEEPEKERARQAMADRLQETLRLLASAGAAKDDFAARLREEAAVWIERRDFSEERVRLGIHLAEVRRIISAPEAAGVSGRKLEFLHQELVREVNTLGTKAQSTAITAQTIELKADLERLKEQLANVS